MTSIQCGHCGGRHESVEEVRSCALVNPLHGDRAPQTEPAEMEEGFYFYQDSIYKVVPSQAGRLYAKIRDGEQWSYAQGAMKFLRPQHKLTKEQAEKYGQTTGVCIICGRTLTNEESMARGIGPICLERF